jgi:endo-1,3-1,4-beta-glycanase ExoK
MRTTLNRPVARALAVCTPLFLALLTSACSGDVVAPGLPTPVAKAAASSALIASPAIADQFNSFDAGIWTKSSYTTPTKNGFFLTNNVGVSGGNLLLYLPQRTYDGGQVETKLAYGYGTYEATIKCSPQAGSMCTVFSYGSNRDEIDIEIYQSAGWKIDFLVWKRGIRSCRQVIPAPFDPSSGYHTYTYRFSSSAVRFYVDGIQRSSCVSSIRLPAPSMKFLLSAWQPSWLSAPLPTSTTTTRVTAASYRP